MNSIFAAIFCVLWAVIFSKGNNSTSPIQLTGKMLLYPQNDRPQYTCVTFIHLVTNDTTLCGAPLINLRHLLAPISCVPDEIPLDNYIVYFSYVIKKPEDRKIIKKTVFPEYGVNFALLFLNTMVELSYDVVNMFVSVEAPTVHSHVWLVRWNENWQVTSRKNKVMVLGIVNREILINDYQIGRLSYNGAFGYNSVVTVNLSTHLRGRLLINERYIFGMATIFHNSTHIGYENLSEFALQIDDKIMEDVCQEKYY